MKRLSEAADHQKAIADLGGLATAEKDPAAGVRAIMESVDWIRHAFATLELCQPK